MQHAWRTLSGILLGALFAIAVYVPLNLQALIPLGGQVLVLTKCNDGDLIALGPPTPGTYIFPYANPYLQHVPAHPGQWKLGVELAPVPEPCTIGPKVQGVGIPVLFYGSSL